MSSTPSPSIPMANLMALSMRHYRLELHQRITRYKQMLLVVLLLTLPGVPAFKAVVLSPLESVYAAGGATSALTNAAYVVLLAFWAFLQREALVSSVAAPMMASLPIGPWRSMARDIALLFLVSLPFTLLLLIASITASGQTSTGTRLVIFAAISALGLAAQIAATRRRYALLLLVIAAAFGNGLMPYGAGGAATLALSGLIVKLLRSVPVPVGDFSVARPKAQEVSERGDVRVTPMGLNWSALYHGRHGAYRFSLALFIALVLVLGLALHGAPGSPVRVVVIEVVFGAVSASVFGLGFGTVFKQQDAFMHVLSALPRGPLQRAIHTMVAVEAPAIALTLLLALSTAREGGRLSFLPIVSTLVLCGIQYLLYRHCPRHTVAAGLVVSVCTVVAISQLALLWSA